MLNLTSYRHSLVTYLLSLFSDKRRFISVYNTESEFRSSKTASFISPITRSAKIHVFGVVAGSRQVRRLLPARRVLHLHRRAAADFHGKRFGTQHLILGQYLAMGGAVI